MIFDITKKLMKMFAKDDCRREEFATYIKKIEKDLTNLKELPEWFKKHRTGAKTVISLSVFWYVAIKPIEELMVREEEVPIKAIKLKKRFYKAIKMLKIKEEAYRMPADIDINQRLEKMSVMDED